jgi:hypothetical protein
MKSVSRKMDRTSEMQSRLQAIREKFQREKPSLKKLVESGDAPPPIPLAAYLELAALVGRMEAESNKEAG